MRRLFAVLGLGLAGCVAFIPEPTTQMAGGDDSRLAELRAGRELYVSKCSACHALYDVNKFPGERWTSEVDEMLRLKKVKLSGVERDRLILYLTAASGRD
jgi:hypothetical protein